MGSQIGTAKWLKALLKLKLKFKHNKANHAETKTFVPYVATVLVPVFAALV